MRSPQAATAFPRDRDSIEPGAETGPAGAPADSYQREYEAMRAWAYPPRQLSPWPEVNYRRLRELEDAPVFPEREYEAAAR